MFYTDIHLKFVDNICYINQKIARTTITITEIFIILFSDNISSESSLIFINFSL